MLEVRMDQSIINAQLNVVRQKFKKALDEGLFGVYFVFYSSKKEWLADPTTYWNGGDIKYKINVNLPSMAISMRPMNMGQHLEN